QKPPRLVRVLHEDPDLAHRLDDEEAEAAARQTVGILEEIQPGSWRPVPVTHGKCLFGGLVLDGMLVRELTVAGAVSAELLGAGDLVLPEDADRPARAQGARRAPRGRRLAAARHAAWVAAQVSRHRVAVARRAHGGAGSRPGGRRAAGRDRPRGAGGACRPGPAALGRAARR